MRLASTLVAAALILGACTQALPTATIPTTATPTAAVSATATARVTATTSPAATATTPPTPTQPAPTATPSADRFALILQTVSDIRGLDPLVDIRPKFMTREELRATLEDDLQEQREETLQVQKLLQLLGLIPADGDLYQMLLSLYSEQIVGFFDTETEELYVITGQEELTPSDELTLAHEYVHALQQQHFGIQTLMDDAEDDSEAQSGLSALIEGDATLVQIEYMNTHLTPQQRQELENASGESPVFEAAPYFLQESLLFPYLHGARLVGYLLAVGGLDALDEAYVDPPRSSEHVLHPERYLAGDDPVPVELPDLTEVLGPAWENVFSDVMGEFFLVKLLENTSTSTKVAMEAAEGWGGDSFVLWEHPDGSLALTTLLAWDTPKEAREFFDAASTALGSPHGQFLGINDDQVLWVLSPSEEITESIRLQFNGF